MRVLHGNVSASSGSAPPAVGIAARDFRFEARIRIKVVFVGAKCNHAYRQCSARVRSPQEASVLCEQSSALRTSGAGSFQAVTPLPPQAPSEESRPSTPRYGFAVFIPAAIPPHLCREESRQKCFGQAGGSRSGCWRRQCQFVPRRSRSPNCHRLRRGLGARPNGHERPTFVPAVGRPGPGPGGRLPTLRAGLFRCSREPKVSLPRRSRARRSHTFQTASGATLHFVPRPKALADSQTPHKATATT